MRRIVLAGGSILALVIALPSYAADFATYRCAGHKTVKVRYDGADRATMIIDGHTLGLRSALSADGSRYVGNGWQWWIVGVRGNLAPLAAGEDFASAPSVPCNSKH